LGVEFFETSAKENINVKVSNWLNWMLLSPNVALECNSRKSKTLKNPERHDSDNRGNLTLGSRDSNVGPQSSHVRVRVRLPHDYPICAFRKLLNSRIISQHLYLTAGNDKF
jgi:hypothetical protein